MSIKRVYTAIKRMRELTHAGIPFSMEFVKYNRTNQTSGHKVVQKALLRTGYSSDHSNLSDTLIAYTDIETGENRQFYLPLLTKFNGTCLK